ncbi:MAG TPA: Fic family protein, partial [Candidatus Nanopelagicales bacterium]|nr:Fic family protein [Candidatus Nanopelagicales bacterium]
AAQPEKKKLTPAAEAPRRASAAAAKPVERERPVRTPEKAATRPAKVSERPVRAAEQVAEAGLRTSERPAKVDKRAAKAAEIQARPSERPAKSSERPAKGNERPAKASERPAKSSERPAKSSERPTKGNERPAKGNERPTKSSERPARSSERPARSSERPSARPGRGSNPPGRSPVREVPRVLALPLPTLPPPRRATIEERSASIEKRLASQSDEFRRRYYASFDMSWIYHDSALEGVVYTYDELTTALRNEAPPLDSSLQPTYDDIRRHKEAIEFVRDYGGKKKGPVTIDCFKKLYLILHPEEGDIKTVKYRKDIPQHRLYFHEYAPPDKIAYKVRQIVDWLNDPETRKTRNGIRIAARAHYDLLRVYPFPVDSGKVSRLFMNMILMRSGLPPAIIHSTERQRYYEALKGSATTVLQMVQEAVENALSSVEKVLDEHESRKRAFVS